MFKMICKENPYHNFAIVLLLWAAWLKTFYVSTLRLFFRRFFSSKFLYTFKKIYTAHCAWIALSITASREAVGTITVRHQHGVFFRLSRSRCKRTRQTILDSVGIGYLFRILFTASTACWNRISFSYAYWCMFN